MKRVSSYPTEFFFTAADWNALQAWRESGRLAPNCTQCGRAIQLKNDCEPVCMDCAFARPSMPDVAARHVRFMEAYLERAQARPTGRPAPPCWELFTSPLAVLSDRNRIPDHLCDFVMRNSTLRWVNENLLPVDNHPVPQSRGAEANEPDWDFWQLRWPFPVGRRSVEEELAPYEARSLPKEAVDEDYIELTRSLLAPAHQLMAATVAQLAVNRQYELHCATVAAAGREIVSRTPFSGTERAMLALRVEIERRGPIDIFGLGQMSARGLDVFLGPLQATWADGTPVADGDWRHPILGNARLLWSRVRRERQRAKPGPKAFTLHELAQAVTKQRAQSGKPDYRPSMRELEQLTNGARTKSALYALLSANGFGGTEEFYDWLDSQ